MAPLVALLVATATAGVASPTLSPAPGTYSSAQKVTVRAASAKARIYCTSDGSAPAPRAALRYASPLSISSTTTIRCAALDGNGARSREATGTYRIAAPRQPSLLNTDIVAGSLTGGEKNLGAYMSLFGHGFGYSTGGSTAQAALGTPSGAQVWLRNPSGDNAWHQVANYRALIPSRVYAKTSVEQIIVQLGSLGGAAPNGAVLDVKVTVAGTDSNVLTGWFTVQPGRFFFVSNGTGTAPAGDDATGIADDITRPFRYAQSCLSGCTGIWGVVTPQREAGLKPGDTIVLRGGTWTDHVGADPGSDGKGRFIRFYPPFNGSAPNGELWHGYFNIVRYPGPILGHAPEDVHYVDSGVDPGRSNSGFVQGTNSVPSKTCCSYVVVSGFRAELTASSSKDAGGVSLQYGSHHWRVFDNEIGPWPNPTNLGLRGSGIEGEGDHVVAAFNYIHDIGGSTAYENHGFYVQDNRETLHNAHNWEIAYNWIENVMGGSCLQWHSSYADAGDGGYYGMLVHHNWFEHCKKSAINMADNMGVGNRIYDNVIVATEQQHGGGALKLTNFQRGMQVDFVHNTVVGFSVWGGSPCLIKSDDVLSSAGGAYVNVTHNILVFGPGFTDPRNAAFDCLTSSGPGGRSSENLYFNYSASGPHTKPSQDATGVYADPKLAAMATGATTCLSSGNCAGATTCPRGGCNYAPQSTSPAVKGATIANPIPVPTDFLGRPRPVPDTSRPGRARNTLGAFE